MIEPSQARYRMARAFQRLAKLLKGLSSGALRRLVDLLS